MRIAFFSAEPLEYGGGWDRFVITVAPQLATYLTLADTVEVITTTPDFFRQLCWVSTVIPPIAMIPTWRESSRAIRRALGDIAYTQTELRDLPARFADVDVIYTTNNPICLFLVATFLPPSVRLIVGTHSPDHFPRIDTIDARLRKATFASEWYHRLLARADAIHANNTTSYRHLRKQFPRKRIAYIPNPFDAAAIGTRVRRRPRSTKIYRILWLGRLHQQKGIADIQAIAGHLARQRFAGRVQLTIAGDGEERKAIERLATRYPTLISYRGHVPYHRTPALIAAHDLLLVTSHYESFGYTVVESQALGVPVLSYDIPGPADLIIEGENGWLAHTPADLTHTLTKLINGEVTYDPARVCAHLARLAPDRTIRALAALIRSAARPSRTPAVRRAALRRGQARQLGARVARR